MSNPILIDVTRDPVGGTFVESTHRGAFAVFDANGQEVYSAGDIDMPMCPRSALKPLQSLAVLESGAVEHFGLGAPEIALSAASHSGEPRHVQIVAEWLKKIDCSIDQLECGPQLPVYEPAARDLIRSGSEPNQMHNNCSGKHVGFMTLARHLGVDVVGYTRPDHPVQQKIAATISEMVGHDVAAQLVGPDGCSAPNYAIPLRSMAHGLARMSRTESLMPQRASAVASLIHAIEDDPFLIAGTGRFCTDVIPLLAGGGIVKTGAEGCYGAVLPGLGLGVAVKIDDGAGRAASATIGAVLQRLGAFAEEGDALDALLFPDVKNRRGTVVGQVRPSLIWNTFDAPLQRA